MSTAWLLLLLAAGCCAAPAKKNVFPPYEPLFTPEELEEIMKLIEGFNNTTDTTERSTQPVLPFTPEQLEEIIQLITTVTKRQEVGEVIDPIVIDWDYFNWIRTLGKRQDLPLFDHLSYDQIIDLISAHVTKKRQDVVTPWEQRGMTEEQYWEWYREWIITLGKRQTLAETLEQLGMTEEQYREWIHTLGKRQDLPLFDHLSYDQIIDLISAHVTKKRQDLVTPWEQRGMTEEQYREWIITLGKRQDLPLFDHLSYDQIIDLISAHVTKKRQDLVTPWEQRGMTEEQYWKWINTLGKRQTLAETLEQLGMTEEQYREWMITLGKRQDLVTPWEQLGMTEEYYREWIITLGKRQLVVPSNLDVLLQEWLEYENITMEQYLAMLDGVNVLRKRQNLPLFEPPLTTDQILNLISDFTTRKRQCLTGTLGKRQDVYDPPLTTDQIISIIANGGVTRKRQCLDKTEESLLGWMQTLGKRQDVYDPPLITDKIISIIELANGGAKRKRGSLAEIAEELGTTEEHLLLWMQSLGKRQDLPLYQPALTTDQIINIIANGGVGKRQDLPLYEPALTTDQIINIIANGGVGKRQDLPLYEPALTTDQIINIIANGGVGKRQDLPLFEPALTTGQIINIIANGGVGKRQDLPLFEPALTHDQIMDLVAQYTTGKRQDDLLGHEIAHAVQSKRETHHSEHRPRVHNPSDPVPPEEEAEAVLLTVQEMNYDQILALLGEYMKGH